MTYHQKRPVIPKQFCSVLHPRIRRKSVASMSLFSAFRSSQLFVKREAGRHVETDSFLFLQELKPPKLSVQVPVCTVTVFFQLHK